MILLTNYSLQEYIIIFYPIPIIFPFLVGMLYYPRLDKQQRYMMFFSLITFIVGVWSGILWLGKNNNLFIGHFYTVIQFLLILRIYQLEFQSKKVKIILTIFMISFVVFSIINTSFFQPLEVQNSNATTLRSILLLFPILTFFIKIITRPKLYRIEKSPMFWFSAGALLYFFCTLFIFAISNSLLPPKFHLISIPIWVLHNVFNYYCRMGFPEHFEINGEALLPLYLAVLTTFVLGVGIIAFCIFYLRRLFTQELKIQQMKNEERKKLLDSSLQAQENERHRIAQDLHDDIGASLATIKLYVSHLVEMAQSKQDSKIPNKVSNLTDNTIDKVRQISRNLSSSNLTQFGLESAINELCTQINEASQELKVVFKAELQQEISAEKALHIYRITQELLNNTLKHAQAKHILIHLSSNSEKVSFVYQDDGIGFDVTDIQKVTIDKSSLGTKTIASRIDMLNATINYHSAPQKGVQVRIQFSL